MSHNNYFSQPFTVFPPISHPYFCIVARYTSLHISTHLYTSLHISTHLYWYNVQSEIHTLYIDHHTQVLLRALTKRFCSRKKCVIHRSIKQHVYFCADHLHRDPQGFCVVHQVHSIMYVIVQCPRIRIFTVFSV